MDICKMNLLIAFLSTKPVNYIVSQEFYYIFFLVMP